MFWLSQRGIWLNKFVNTVSFTSMYHLHHHLHSSPNQYHHFPAIPFVSPNTSSAWIWLVSMRMRVGSLALFSGWASGIAMSCEVAHRRGLDSLLLRRRLAAVALILPQAWELTYAASAALKRKEKKTKQKNNLMFVFPPTSPETFKWKIRWNIYRLVVQYRHNTGYVGNLTFSSSPIK